jgi:hypothetical protein
LKTPATVKPGERKKWDSFGDNIAKSKPTIKNLDDDDNDIIQDDDKNEINIQCDEDGDDELKKRTAKKKKKKRAFGEGKGLKGLDAIEFNALLESRDVDPLISQTGDQLPLMKE